MFELVYRKWVWRWWGGAAVWRWWGRCGGDVMFVLREVRIQPKEVVTDVTVLSATGTDVQVEIVTAQSRERKICFIT